MALCLLWRGGGGGGFEEIIKRFTSAFEGLIQILDTFSLYQPPIRRKQTETHVLKIEENSVLGGGGEHQIG
jgi:hypothetical protein